jgi:hypothetical protein
MFCDHVTELEHVNAGEQRFTRAKHNRRDGNMQLVDQPCLKILADCRHATGQSNILALRRFGGQLERNMNAIGHEMKCGAALHRD